MSEASRRTHEWPRAPAPFDPPVRPRTPDSLHVVLDAPDELDRAYEATIEGWSRALDLRDPGTHMHARRVADLVVDLARAMGVATADLVHVRRGALLHDVGKMGVPDAVLRKPAPLADDEWAMMRRHPVLALEMLSPVAFLRPALDIPFAHHERWDGSGYPCGLRGDEIPPVARLFAVCDVWDAIRSDRVYRAAWSAGDAHAYIRAGAGSLFDPDAVEAFLDLRRAR